MVERTKRGEENREREDDKMQGEPVGDAKTGQAGTQVTNTTRDKGVEPAKDARRDGQGREES